MAKNWNKLTGRLLNALAAQDNNSTFRIDLDAKPSAQNRAMNLLIADLGTNFVMTNIDNLIRSQIYNDLKASEIADRDFGFWKTASRSGEEFINENTINGSSRTGNPVIDILSISQEPEAEIKVITYDDNYAVDLKANKQLQHYATLDGLAGWIEKRYANQKKSLDKFIHNLRLADITGYLGYTEILVDTTGLTKEEVATAFEIEIHKQFGYLTSGYTQGNSLGFDNIFDPNEIGIIFSVEANVNRLISYLRKQVHLDEGEKDFGAGHIIQKVLTEEQEAIILPQAKFIWGADYGSLDTALGFSLIENLKTDYVFTGSLFMDSAPAIRITAGTPETFTAKMVNKIEKAKEYIAKRLEALEKAKDKHDTRDYQARKKQFNDYLKLIKAINVESMVKAAKVVKYEPADLTKKLVFDTTDMEERLDKKTQKHLDYLAKSNEDKIKDLKSQLAELEEANQEMDKAEAEEQGDNE